MDRLVVRTDVLASPAAVYDFLVDFPGYARYSEYLTSVERRGDGATGTTYDITVSWWRLSHTLTSRVIDTDRPHRIDWEVDGSLAAAGDWSIAPVEDPDVPPAATPADGAAVEASRVTLTIRYDPRSVDAERLDLPALFSLDALVDRVVPLVEDEAERVVERVVADLEGEPRPVTLYVETEN